MNKEVYIDEFTATSINKDECGVIAKIIFKDTLTLEEVRNIKTNTYLKLSDGVENDKLKQTLLDIREYAIKEKEFNDNQINEYKTCIETNLNGKFNKEEKENMEHSMTVNICINYKLNDILQIIDKVLGSDENE